jgi:hypothetical protein
MSIRYQVFGRDLKKKWNMDSIYDQKDLAILSAGILLENSSYIAVRVVEVDINTETRMKKLTTVHTEKRRRKKKKKDKTAKGGGGGKRKMSTDEGGSTIGVVTVTFLALAGIGAAGLMIWLQFFS